MCACAEDLHGRHHIGATMIASVPAFSLAHVCAETASSKPSIDFRCARHVQVAN